jgi:hypothetical protein
MRVLVGSADNPATMVATRDGGLLYGERLTGRVRVVDPHGRLRATPLATVAVSIDGQRGLLGLAVDRRDRVFAAWSDPARVLVVAQIHPAPVRMVWRGPTTTEEANGGRLAFLRDGTLVLGVGDLLDRERVADPLAPNGKLLGLDADGAPDQRPRVLSSGWNNPFAFTVTPDGAVWVADNAPGIEPERLARGDVGGRPTSVRELPTKTVPSGLAAVDDRTLVVCGFSSGRLLEFHVDPRRRTRPPRTLATDCRLGVVRLGDRLAYATDRGIKLVEG